MRHKSVNTSGAIPSELIVLLKILRSMLVELEETCRIALDIGVTKVIDVLLQGLLDVLNLLRGILCLMLVELSRSVLQFVGCGTFTAL